MTQPVTAGDAMWTPHLQPGETLLWRGASSPVIRKAHFLRKRAFNAGLTLVTALLAALAGYRFYEVLAHDGAPNIASGFAAPLYVAFAIAMGVAAIMFAWGFMALGSPYLENESYAATNLRLLAADDEGRLVDEVAGADIAGADLGEGKRPTHLFIQRASAGRAFVMSHIEDAGAVKALIQTTFPEAHP